MKDYRQILKSEFSKRHAANPRYSQRAFARDLKISQGRLSDIMAGRTGLSAARAVAIATNLGFSQNETEFFRDLVASQHARSQTEKAVASARLRKYGMDGKRKALLEDAFSVISDWQHLAILELAKLVTFRPTASWIGKALGISVYEAKLSLARLERLGLLKVEDGKVQTFDVETDLANAVPSDSIKNFHRQIMQKALGALDTQPMKEREFNSIIVAIKATDIERFKSQMRKFACEIASEENPASDVLYCYSQQFFRLDMSR